jgi:hypothetical protein
VPDNETYRYIYDCGSNAQNLVIERVDRYLRNEQIEGRDMELDMLVLSHFHFDHINGLPHLFSLFGVRKLVVPFLSNDFALIALASLAASGSAAWTAFNGLILDPEAWVRSLGHNETEITRIHPGDAPDDAAPDRIPEDGIYLPAGTVSHHVTGSISATGAKFWDFKFYVQEDFGKYLLVLGALYDTFAPTTEQQLLSWFSDPVWIAANHLTVKEIFKSLGSNNQNGITLCMYSGPSYGLPVHGNLSWPSSEASVHCYHSKRIGNMRRGLGWLGTGDAELRTPVSFGDFFTHYKDYVNAIDTLTIPHHGSIDNYSGGLGDIAFSTVLTSNYAEDPHGHHPNELVMTNLRTKCNLIFVVTREMESAVFSRSHIYLG